MCDRCLRGTGPFLSMRADPHLRVKAFSYRFVMPCRRYCYRLVRECISSGTVLPCESPQRESKTCPWFLIEKSFYRKADAKKEMTFGFFGQGEKEESHWGVGEKNKNALYRNPLDVSFLPLHTNTIPLASVTGPAFFNSQPFFSFFFYQPVTHCAGKSDFLFSWGSKLKAQP